MKTDLMHKNMYMSKEEFDEYKQHIPFSSTEQVQIAIDEWDDEQLEVLE